MLEEKIDKLATAILQLNALLEERFPIPSSTQAPATTPEPKSKKEKEKKDPTTVTGKPLSEAIKEEAAKADPYPVTTAAESAITREDVANLVIKLAATKSREAALEVLNAHGAARVPDLAPSTYPAVHAALVAALEARP